MKTLKEIKDEVAKKYQYDSWDDVRYYDCDLRMFDDIARIVHRQACEAQRDLCMGGMGWKPEKVLQIPLIELK